MKVGLITDTHWGVRNDHTAFIEHYKLFYDRVFFPTLKDLGITDVIMLGDTFDRRKYTNHTTIKAAREIYFDKLLENGINTTILVGNHDTFFRNTLSTNSVSLLLSEYPNIRVIDKPQSIVMDDLEIALVPWICNDNQEDCMNFMGTTKAQICMGHFEIKGFEMYRGQSSAANQSGLAMDVFERFDLVFSGHYHHRSTKRNITYLGSPYETTWHDYGDPKGFHIFDTDSRGLQFIENYHKMFYRLEYNDLNQEPIDLDGLDLQKIYVKLIVVNKTNFVKFEKFLTKLYGKGCHDVRIVEDMHEPTTQDIDNSVDFNDTLTVLEKHIDSLEVQNKEHVKHYIKSLYLEAITLEDAAGL